MTVRLPIEDFQARTASMWGVLTVTLKDTVLHMTASKTIQDDNLTIQSLIKISREVRSALLNALVIAGANTHRAWMVRPKPKHDKHTFLSAKDRKLTHGGSLYLGMDAPEDLSLDEVKTVLGGPLAKVAREVEFKVW